MNGDRPLFKLPPEPYLPGLTERPGDDYFQVSKEGLSKELPVDALLSSDAFAHGLDAFQKGYYWEAHELLEAVWMCLPPASAERLLVQGLIQLANAGLKNRMGRPQSARRILALAEIALAEAVSRNHRASKFIAFDHLEAMRYQVASTE